MEADHGLTAKPVPQEEQTEDKTRDFPRYWGVVGGGVGRSISKQAPQLLPINLGPRGGSSLFSRGWEIYLDDIIMSWY